MIGLTLRVSLSVRVLCAGAVDGWWNGTSRWGSARECLSSLVFRRCFCDCNKDRRSFCLPPNKVTFLSHSTFTRVLGNAHENKEHMALTHQSRTGTAALRVKVKRCWLHCMLELVSLPSQHIGMLTTFYVILQLDLEAALLSCTKSQTTGAGLER